MPLKPHAGRPVLAVLMAQMPTSLFRRYRRGLISAGCEQSQGLDKTFNG
jgi:hypothetical protein